MELLPFDARLVRQEVAEHVVVPSFDELTPEDRTRVRDAEPLSFLHAMHGPGEGALSRSREGLERLLREGAFGPRMPRALFGYRISAGEHVQTGVVGAVRAGDVGRGRAVRTHEDVRPEMSRHLTHYLRELRVASSPVTAVVAAQEAPTTLLAELVARPPDLDVGSATDPGGVRQQWWAVTEPDEVDGLVTAFRRVERAYVTDGHHRSAAALAVGPDTPVLVALFPDDSVRVVQFNRVVRPVAERAGVRRWLRADGDRVEGRPTAPARGDVLVRCDGEWWRVALPTTPGLEPPASLDPAVLQDRVLAPLLGVADPADDPRLVGVPGSVPLDELAARAGDDGVAFAIAPLSFDDVRAVADHGGTMPPKSTFFAPKPRSGCVLLHL